MIVFEVGVLVVVVGGVCCLPPCCCKARLPLGVNVLKTDHKDAKSS